MTKRTMQATISPSRRRITLITGAIVAGIAAGLAGIYGIAGLSRNADPACASAVQLTQVLKPLARGEVAAVNVPEKPLHLPALAFKDGTGKAHTLADWKDRVVLLNLWATWCVPCRKEMPGLEALQKKIGGPRFEVVAVNIDTRDLDKPKAWLNEVGVSDLNYYADPSAKIFQDLKGIGRAFGMPTTLLIDGKGCELGTIAGPAEWASDDALKLIRAALGQS